MSELHPKILPLFSGRFPINVFSYTVCCIVSSLHMEQPVTAIKTKLNDDNEHLSSSSNLQQKKHPHIEPHKMVMANDGLLRHMLMVQLEINEKQSNFNNTDFNSRTYTKTR